MSTLVSPIVAPSVAKVLTHGPCHGSDIAKGERSAKDIAQEIANASHGIGAKSCQSLIAEEALRAQARMTPTKEHPQGRGISKFQRVARELDKLGLDDVALAMYELLGALVAV